MVAVLAVDIDSVVGSQGISPTSIDTKVSAQAIVLPSGSEAKEAMITNARYMFNNQVVDFGRMANLIREETDGALDLTKTSEYEDVLRAWAILKAAAVRKLRDYEPKVGVYYPQESPRSR